VRQKPKIVLDILEKDINAMRNGTLKVKGNIDPTLYTEAVNFLAKQSAVPKLKWSV
jgi:hypothetical protein